MAIPSIDLPAIPAITLDPVAPVSSTGSAPLGVARAITFPSSIVTFSPLAQLLAVTFIFQAQQGKHVPPEILNQDKFSTFQQLLEAAVDFVNAFNSFQNSINNNSASAFEITFDQALLSAMHDKNDPSGSASIHSFINSLAQVGIQFQEVTSLNNSNQFQVSMTSLQLAYSQNPTQTTALLVNAFQALIAIEEKLLPAQEIPSVSGTPMASTDAATTSSTIPTVPIPTEVVSSIEAAPALSPLTQDPTIAHAIAAYRLNQNIEHVPVNPPTDSATEVISGVTKIGKINKLGADTHKNAATSQQH